MAKELNEVRRFSKDGNDERRKFRRRAPKKEKEHENDEHRLAQRMKQIQYGENTPGYLNLLKALELYPERFRGQVPLKPSVTQKCSKRSWDGQIRKWRRALHKYDFVDFEDDAQVDKFLRESLIEQNLNPLFCRTLGPNGTRSPTPEHRLEGSFLEESEADAVVIPRVRYSLEHLLRCCDNVHVQPTIALPPSLQWLDKRVDLEDDLGDCDSDTWAPGVATQSTYSPGYGSECSAATPSKGTDLDAPCSPTGILPTLLFPPSPLCSDRGSAPAPVPGLLQAGPSLMPPMWGLVQDIKVQDLAGVLQGASRRGNVQVFPPFCNAGPKELNPLLEPERNLQQLHL